MIPLYILGLLLRFGPQHGYQIKKRMEEQLEDFTQIKLPAVYYHLEKMEAAGFLTACRDKQGARPEKTVYRISETGTSQFQKLLLETLHTPYRPAFDRDASFYFAEYLRREDLLDGLQRHASRLEKALEIIGTHRAETLELLPEDARMTAGIIFEHHILHYQAELDWTNQSIRKIKEASNP